MEYGRLIAGLTRFCGDVGLAEELAQEAFVAALEQWPNEGVPANPGAWLMTVAKRRAIDLFRRNERLAGKYAQIGRELGAHGADGPDPGRGDIDDDLLGLIFIACHPVLSLDARVALTLRLVGGLTTPEIARAYLVPEPTIAQRIVRAKRTIARANAPFEAPRGADRSARLGSVLEVIYLIFNEGYAASAGDDWTRPELCEDALRLGRVLVHLTPDEPEVHGLVALMELQSSRIGARTDPAGGAILLADQDRTRWDQPRIARGLAELELAKRLEGAPGPYVVQGAIAACHARARRYDDTDWFELVELYTTLARLTPSPVVELNRAVAVAMAMGPKLALDLVDQIAATGALEGYHLLASVRGDLLGKLDRPAEAKIEFERAATQTHNAQERALCVQRARDAEAAARR